MASKKSLAIILSGLKEFENPKMKEEQYTLGSEISADILWRAYMNSDISGRSITDLGCGTGILGIGALLLGAKKVYFVDKDADVFPNLLTNIKNMSSHNLKITKKVEVLHLDINDFSQKTDITITNPPWGTKSRHIEKEFLKKAFKISRVVYAVNKVAKHRTMKRIAAEYNFKPTAEWDYLMPLKNTMKEHIKPKKIVKIVCMRFEKI